MNRQSGKYSQLFLGYMICNKIANKLPTVPFDKPLNFADIGELREQKHGFRGEKSGFLPLQEELENQTVADGMECPAIQRPTHLGCWVSGTYLTLGHLW